MSFIPDRVVCVSAYDNQWGGCTQTRPEMVGQTFTVARVDVRSWHTKLSFDEYPGEVFNSVHFEPYSWRTKAAARVRRWRRRVK